MTAHRAEQLIKDCRLFLRDMSREWLTQSIRQIDAALKANQTEMLQDRRLIPRSVKLLNKDSAEMDALIASGVESAQAFVRTPNAKEMIGLPFMAQAVVDILNDSLHVSPLTAALRSALIEDVWSGSETFSEQSYARAQELRAHLLESLMAHDTIGMQPITLLDYVSATPIFSGLALITAEVTEDIVSLLRERVVNVPGSGVYPVPRRERSKVIRDLLEADDFACADVFATFTRDDGPGI